MENVLYVLKCIAFVIVPLVVWGLLAFLLESWVEKMVNKGRLPEEYAFSDKIGLIGAPILLLLMFAFVSFIYETYKAVM